MFTRKEVLWDKVIAVVCQQTSGVKKGELYMSRTTGSSIFNRFKEAESRPINGKNHEHRPRKCAECRKEYPDIFKFCPKGKRRAMFSMSPVKKYCRIAVMARESTITSAAGTSC